MPSKKKNYVDRETVPIPSYPPTIETVSEYLDREYWSVFLPPPTYQRNREIGTKIQGAENNIFFLWVCLKKLPFVASLGQKTHQRTIAGYVVTWETLLGLLKRPNLKEKETFRRPSRLEKVTIDNYRFRFLSFYFLLSGGKNFMFEITPFFPTKKHYLPKNLQGISCQTPLPILEYSLSQE